MERRELLKLGAMAGVGGLVGAGNEGCLLPALLTQTDPGSPPDMDVYLALIDRGLARIESWNPPGSEPGAADDRAAQAAPLCRKAMKSLFLTAMFSDLPPESQAHPGMQDRIWKAVPEINEAVLGTADLLRSQTSEQLGSLQRKLQDPANPGMLMAEIVDRGGASCGIPAARRLRTRTMFAHIDGRLRKQPPAMLVDEILTKVGKLRERNAPVAGFRKELVRRLGETAVREHEQRLAAYEQRWRAMGATPTDAMKQDAALGDVQVQWPFEPPPQAAVEPEPQGAPPPPAQPQPSPPAFFVPYDEPGSPPPQPQVQPPAQPQPQPQPQSQAQPWPQPQPPPEEEETAGDKVFTDGLIVLGVSVGLSLLAVPIMFGNIIVSFIMWTVGGILLLAGLITMIVGAAMD